MSAGQKDLDLRFLALSGDRTLAWYEFGDREGVPCLYVPGTPESGLAGSCYDGAAASARIRWIAIDKPGYGRSDPMWKRTLRDFAADIEVLVDHLGFQTFVVAGESGGGPHALAVGSYLPDRTDAVVLLGSAGVGGDRGVPQGMTPMNTLLFQCLRFGARGVRIPLAIMAFVMRYERFLGSLLQLLDRGVPQSDKTVMGEAEYALRLQAVPDAFRQGTRPAAEELAMLRREWGFDVRDLKVPVHMWHGVLDANVPIALAEDLRRQLPEVHTRFYPDAAHAVGFERRAEVMDVVVACAQSPGSVSPD